MNAEDAFIPSQDTGPFFASGPASMVLTQLERGLEDASPVIVLTGEPGVGKTTVVREAITRWGARVHAVWFEIDTDGPEKTLLKTIRALGGHGRAKDERPELIARMAHALKDISERNVTPLLIVDDAHDLDLDMLAEVGRIEGAAIAADQTLKVLLVGEPQLNDLLDGEELEILSQRMAISCRLEPMEQADTRQYLNHRVGAAGGDASNAFSRKAAREIHVVTRGVPGAINSLADDAQRRANATNAGVVTPDHVRAVMAATRRATANVAETRIRPQPQVVTPATPAPPQAPPKATPSAVQPRPSGTHARVTPSAQTPRPAAAPAPPAAPKAPASLSSTPNAPGGPKHAAPVPPRVKRVPPPPVAPPAAPPESAVDLDSSHPRVKEWVSRFTDGNPLRIGGGLPPQPITDPSSIPDANPIFADEDELLLPPEEIPVTQAPQPPVPDEPLPLTLAPPAPETSAPPEPHAVDLPADEPLISAEALMPPPLVLNEKPAEATPSGTIKRPAATPRPSASMPKPAVARPSGSLPRPKPNAGQAPAPEAKPAAMPPTAKSAGAAHKARPQAAPKPVAKAAAPAAPPPEPPAVLTKKDVKPAVPSRAPATLQPKPPQPPAPADIADDDDLANLPSPTVYRVLAALIPIVLIVGMAATAIVLSRRSAFDREPESADQSASTASAAPTETVQAVPAAPPAPAPPPLVVTPDTEVTPAPVETARYCLSVGTYLFSDRARARTEQLSRRTHLKSWIITTTADGSYTYRVMLGGWATRADAERMADKFLESGLVSEALVEPLPPQ